MLVAFLRLGLTSFGGPAAHLGYFRDAFVVRRRWLPEEDYAHLVGLCQFLPGPASSQAGFAIGLLRAGWLGGLAAWTGFTLPSAVLMVLSATAGRALRDAPAGAGVLHGLKLAAVAVVAQAVWGMARSLCPDRTRASLATAAAVLAVLAPAAWGQVAVIAAAALAGLALCPDAAEQAPAAALPSPVGRGAGLACLALFAALLLLCLLPNVASALLPGAAPSWASALAFPAAFYRAGALVFGGGHVVLPLLRDAVVQPGWVDAQAFLAGYGAAQALPGPLFTLAAYLGAAAAGLGGALVALAAVFLPGLLLVAGTLPFWTALRRRRAARRALWGVNAAVVGLLGAALYDPVWTGTVARTADGRADFALALAAFVLLTAWRAPPLLIVALLALAGCLLPATA